jgi:hypothetical protein
LPKTLKIAPGRDARDATTRRPPYPLSLPATARTVRVASYNVLFGVGSVNGPEYNAVADILTRIDADVVAFQELTSGNLANWKALADELGYGHGNGRGLS